MAFGRPFRPGAVLTLASFALALLLSSPALAQRELLTKPGQKGQVVIDQISGFRGGVSGIVGGQNELAPAVDYYGPIGFAIQHYSQADARFSSNVDSVTATTFWVAPSFDVFVIDHLSVGGMVQLAYTGNSASEPIGASRSVNVNIPSNVSFSAMPRVGWMFALGDRWAIWPRFSIGYVTDQIGAVVPPGGKVAVGGSSISGLGLDVDAGVLFRVNETFFLRLAPEAGWIAAGSNSTTVLSPRGNPQTETASANYLEFTLTGGIGVMFEL
jgi:hypothetical protein